MYVRRIVSVRGEKWREGGIGRLEGCGCGHLWLSACVVQVTSRAAKWREKLRRSGRQIATSKVSDHCNMEVECSACQVLKCRYSL
jgi:hypothetical protein